MARRMLRSLILALGLLAPLAADDVVMVVANGSELQEISAREISALFTGMTRTVGLRIARPAVLRQGGAHQSFLDRYIGKSPAQYYNWWKRLVFTGKADFPKAFDSEEQMAAFLAENPSYIGYLSPGHVTGDLKVLTVRE